ncbi:MAG: AmmeMemoRadiSam system protein B [Candidatus Methylomirabilia bacterium]
MRAATAGTLFAIALLAAAPGAGAQPSGPPGTGKAEGASAMNGISLQFAEFKGDAAELARRIDAMLAAASAPERDEAPLALVSPHAGYVYSGPIAAFAYRAVQGRSYDTIVVIGPSHRDAFTGLSVYDTPRFETPLGRIPCDRDLIGRLVGAHPNIVYRPSAHRDEHSLEVQVPFLQRALTGFNLVMVVAGGRDPEAELKLVDVLADYAKHKRLLVVASSDLSHYHGYAEANKLDAVALKSIAALDTAALTRDIGAARCEACGILPVLITMEYAKRLGARRGVLLKQANSGDTAGPKDQVVGYAALAFWADGAGAGEKASEKSGKEAVGPEGTTVSLGRLDGAARAELLGIARRAIAETVRGSQRFESKSANPALQTPQGAFVTITIGGQLRGCIGTFREDTPLFRTVAQMAQAAAREDPRFPPLTAAELPKIHVEISALTPMKPVADVAEIEVGRHGLYITRGFNSGVLLPQVATEYGWDRTTFLEQTCRKAGLPKNAWQEGAKILSFEAEVFGE